MKEALGVLTAFVIVLGLIVGGAFFTFAMNSYFQPAYRNLDNKVFKQSEQYNDGMIRDLYDIQRQYIAADDTGKQALKAIVLHRFEVYPESKMPDDLREFYEKLRSE